MPPAKTIRPGLVALWMLNDASTVREKIEYIRACHAGGMRALCMHPRSGNLIPYASDEWFRMIRALVSEGRRLGMDMWLYDEDPYPSGAAGGIVMTERPDLRAVRVARREKPRELKPGDLWLIGEERVLWAGLVPVARPLKARDLTRAVGPVRTDWFMGRWDSRYYYEDTPIFPAPRGDAFRSRFTMRVPEIPKGQKLVAFVCEFAGQEGSWGCLPDLLNPETFRLFRELALDPYEDAVGSHFGKTIPGIFTDEGKPHGVVPITGDLLDSFRRTYGYDLLPRFYQLFGEPLSDQYVQTRLDYRRWVTERFLDAFMRPYSRWCKAHDLHLVGHLSPEDDPVPEAYTIGAVMPIMKLLGLPGTDLIVPFTGSTEAPCVNLGSLRAGSLKSQLGRPYAMSETLALSGWSVTTEKCRQLFAWQKVLGIDRFFIHGFFNSNEGVQNYEAAPDYGPGSSIFAGMGVLNGWMKSLDTVLDGGRERAEVAVLSALESYWSWGEGMDESRLGAMRTSLWQTILSLLRSHVGVHVLDEEDLCRARVRAGGIRIGKREYRAVLVPAIDILTKDALAKLRTAAGKGVGVTWFDGGPRRVTGARNRLGVGGRLPGQVLKMQHASVAWCRKHFTPQIGLTGKGKEDCYVRRFVARKGGDYALIANVSDEEIALQLKGEEGRTWAPAQVDGEVCARARTTTWTVPPLGCGVFKLGPAPSAEAAPPRVARRPAGRGRTFERLEPNVLRLDHCTVVGAGGKSAALDFPRPYWQVFDEYQARRTWSTYMGKVPLESAPSDNDLRYAFSFSLSGKVKPPHLVLDPRCARGRFRVLLNGKAIGGRRTWPLSRIRPARVALRGLRRGGNVLEFCFDARSAMDGLLSPVRIEGDFDAKVSGRRLLIAPPARRCSAKGWQAAGMPHYMGRGRYRWRETLTARDLERAWSLEIEQVVDSAELLVNGKSVGARAWRPWCWPLRGLRKGSNTFELIVSGTAGNLRELDWPNQPQGWIGHAWLVANAKGEES